MSKSILFIILAATLLCAAVLSLSPCFFSNFFIIDDFAYILDNNLLHDMTGQNITKICTSFFKGNYQPLTFLSYMVEYHFFGPNPFFFHLTNVLFHLANTILVFYLFQFMLKNIRQAFFIALFFAIHPLQVEPVAWLSSRKDVLYGFFFLGSLIFYLHYAKHVCAHDQNRRTNGAYELSFLLFILALLAKVPAAMLPAIFLLCDIRIKRRINWSLLWEKMPFVLISIFAVAITYSSEASDHSFRPDLGGWAGNIFIAGYTLIWQTVKTILPLKLSVIYPTPAELRSFIPPLFVTTTIISLSITVLALFSIKRFRTFAFGWLFFFLMLFPAIAFPLGGSITNDRYMYLPILGLIYIFVMSLEKIRQHIRPLNGKRAITIVTSVLCITLMGLTFKQAQTWKNSITVLNDNVKKYPNAYAYNAQGAYYLEIKDYPSAIDATTKTLEVFPDYVDAHFNRALAYQKLNKPEKAIEDFSSGIKINPLDADCYRNRGVLLSEQGNYEEAIKDISQAIIIDNGAPDLFADRGLTYLRAGQFDKAIADFTQTIRLGAITCETYANRGIAFMEKGNREKALQDFDRALAINPKHEAALRYRQKLLNSGIVSNVKRQENKQ